MTTGCLKNVTSILYFSFFPFYSFIFSIPCFQLSFTLKKGQLVIFYKYRYIIMEHSLISLSLNQADCEVAGGGGKLSTLSKLQYR